MTDGEYCRATNILKMSVCQRVCSFFILCKVKLGRSISPFNLCNFLEYNSSFLYGKGRPTSSCLKSKDLK